MSASELMYFDGQPLAHVVAFEDHLRARRIAKQAEGFARRGGHRIGRRWGDAL